eukprot:GHVN01067108.1.p1 GENE.GHVN01067108.1~~GHVN01067108.1.p1  ORF type:complete len:1474 (-),score=273.12 GHVN01067108.1:3791-8059(-)
MPDFMNASPSEPPAFALCCARRSLWLANQVKHWSSMNESPDQSPFRYHSNLMDSPKGAVGVAPGMFLGSAVTHQSPEVSQVSRSAALVSKKRLLLKALHFVESSRLLPEWQGSPSSSHHRDMSAEHLFLESVRNGGERDCDRLTLQQCEAVGLYCAAHAMMAETFAPHSLKGENGNGTVGSERVYDQCSGSPLSELSESTATLEIDLTKKLNLIENHTQMVIASLHHLRQAIKVLTKYQDYQTEDTFHSFTGTASNCSHRGPHLLNYVRILYAEAWVSASQVFNTLRQSLVPIAIQFNNSLTHRESSSPDRIGNDALRNNKMLRMCSATLRRELAALHEAQTVASSTLPSTHPPQPCQDTTAKRPILTGSSPGEVHGCRSSHQAAYKSCCFSNRAKSLVAEIMVAEAEAVEALSRAVGQITSINVGGDPPQFPHSSEGVGMDTVGCVLKAHSVGEATLKFSEHDVRRVSTFVMRTASEILIKRPTSTGIGPPGSVTQVHPIQLPNLHLHLLLPRASEWSQQPHHLKMRTTTTSATDDDDAACTHHKTSTPLPLWLQHSPQMSESESRVTEAGAGILSFTLKSSAQLTRQAIAMYHSALSHVMTHHPSDRSQRCLEDRVRLVRDKVIKTCATCIGTILSRIGEAEVAKNKQFSESISTTSSTTSTEPSTNDSESSELSRGGPQTCSPACTYCAKHCVPHRSLCLAKAEAAFLTAFRCFYEGEATLSTIPSLSEATWLKSDLDVIDEPITSRDEWPVVHGKEVLNVDPHLPYSQLILEIGSYLERVRKSFEKENDEMSDSSATRQNRSPEFVGYAVRSLLNLSRVYRFKAELCHSEQNRKMMDQFDTVNTVIKDVWDEIDSQETDKVKQFSAELHQTNVSSQPGSASSLCHKDSRVSLMEKSRLHGMAILCSELAERTIIQCEDLLSTDHPQYEKKDEESTSAASPLTPYLSSHHLAHTQRVETGDVALRSPNAGDDTSVTTSPCPDLVRSPQQAHSTRETNRADGIRSDATSLPQKCCYCTARWACVCGCGWNGSYSWVCTHCEPQLPSRGDDTGPSATLRRDDGLTSFTAPPTIDTSAPIMSPHEHQQTKSSARGRSSQRRGKVKEPTDKIRDTRKQNAMLEEVRNMAKKVLEGVRHISKKEMGLSHLIFAAELSHSFPDDAGGGAVGELSSGVNDFLEVAIEHYDSALRSFTEIDDRRESAVAHYHKASLYLKHFEWLSHSSDDGGIKRLKQPNRGSQRGGSSSPKRDAPLKLAFRQYLKSLSFFQIEHHCADFTNIVLKLSKIFTCSWPPQGCVGSEALSILIIAEIMLSRERARLSKLNKAKSAQIEENATRIREALKATCLQMLKRDEQLTGQSSMRKFNVGEAVMESHFPGFCDLCKTLRNSTSPVRVVFNAVIRGISLERAVADIQGQRKVLSGRK